MIKAYGLYLINRRTQQGYSYFFPENAIALYGALIAMSNGFAVRVTRQDYEGSDEG